MKEIRHFDIPLYPYMTKNQKLIHKLKESWCEEEFDGQGKRIKVTYYSKTYCGLRLTHERRDNKKINSLNYNCRRCMKKEEE